MTTETSYERAPLIELVVEVRWPVRTVTIAGGFEIVGDASPAFDIWFQGIAAKAKEQGFDELERLVPHDAPPFAHQPIFRFKKSGHPFPLYQFGHGIFTINAGPPSYFSWTKFRPQVEAGLEALVLSMPQDDNKVDNFYVASLRYIDAFKEDLRGGMSNYAFMRDALGVSINLPGNLLDCARDENEIAPTIAVQMPVANDDGGRLTFQLAAGRLAQSQQTDTIMDITYAVNRPITPDVVELLKILDNGRNLLHDWFERLTLNIRERMQPIQDD